MKKKVLYAVACVALAAVAGWNYQQSKQDVELSDLALENVEALASGEAGRGCTVDLNAICETSHNDYIGYRNN